MTEIREGDRIRITVAEATVTNTYPHTHLPDASGHRKVDRIVVYRTDTQDGQSSLLVLDDPAITVERLAPAEWPPRPGDLWRDREGDVWFAVEDEDGTITMVCQVTACVSRPPDEFMRTFDPLSFVHREDEQDGGDRG